MNLQYNIQRSKSNGVFIIITCYYKFYNSFNDTSDGLRVGINYKGNEILVKLIKLMI